MNAGPPSRDRYIRGRAHQADPSDTGRSPTRRDARSAPARHASRVGAALALALLVAGTLSGCAAMMEFSMANLQGSVDADGLEVADALGVGSVTLTVRPDAIAEEHTADAEGEPPGSARLLIAVTCEGDDDAAVHLDDEVVGATSCGFEQEDRGYVSLTTDTVDLTMQHTVRVDVGERSEVAVTVVALTPPAQD